MNDSVLKPSVSAMADEEPQQNIQYVLLAEFDIDKGSLIKHQYPKPCPISPNILADLMLPEGAHLLADKEKPEDFTYFFLRESEKQSNARKKKRRLTKIDKWERNRQDLITTITNSTFSVQVLEFSESVSDWFINYDVAICQFVYSGTWTKEDEAIPEISIKISEIDNPDGQAIVTAPINVDTQWTVLSEAELFCSFYPPRGNAMGVKFQKFTALKACTEIVTQVTEPKKRPPVPVEEDEAQDAVEVVDDVSLEEQIVVLNLVRTVKDKDAIRGAKVKSIAIATRLQILHTFKPLLKLALDDYYRYENMDILRTLYDTLNAVSFDPNQQQRLADHPMMEQKEQREDASSVSVPVKFLGINLRLNVPRHVGADEITGISLIALFNRFRSHNGMAILYNGVFTQRRIIFVGHNLPSSLIANMVLATCLLVSPAIEGTLKRAYPYACLTAMQFLSVSGYIAGVTNPIFEQRQEWYDILCNVATGEVKLSESYQNELADQTIQPLYNKVLSMDKVLMSEIRNGLQLKYGEKWIRSMFQDYTDHIVRMALDMEVFENEEIKDHDNGVNEWRIQEWEKSESYLDLLNLIEQRKKTSPFKMKTGEMNLMIRTIQIKPLQDDKARTYLAKIDHWLDTKEKIRYFVQKLNPSLGYKVMEYMFHSDEFISGKALDIALKLESYSNREGSDYLEEANQVMKSLNFFYLVALQRLKVERSAGLRKQKQLKRKLDNQDVHTGNIQYHNIHKVNKQTSSMEISNKFQNLQNGDGHQKTGSNSLSNVRSGFSYQ